MKIQYFCRMKYVEDDYLDMRKTISLDINTKYFYAMYSAMV